MRYYLFTLFVLPLFPASLLAEDAESVMLREPWDSSYQGEDAEGKHVLGLWQFEPDAPAADSSSHGHQGTLEDAKPCEKGRFGACLECFPGHPVEDKRHRLLVKNDPSLSPRGAFTLEMWLMAKPELDEKYPSAFLIDKKYVAQTD